jgi:hypothetical protein
MNPREQRLGGTFSVTGGFALITRKRCSFYFPPNAQQRDPSYAADVPDFVSEVGWYTVPFQLPCAEIKYRPEGWALRSLLSAGIYCPKNKDTSYPSSCIAKDGYR